MGGVKDQYLFRECAGDKYVVRCACGLNYLEKNFVFLPAYFDYSEYDEVGHIQN